MAFNSEFSEVGNHNILRAYGTIEYENIPEVDQILLDVINISKKSLIIDLSNLEYIDSSGISLLVDARAKMKQKEGDFALLGIQAQILKILQVSELDKYFTIFNKEEEIP
jgi:anti-anti-sigma factor